MTLNSVFKRSKLLKGEQSDSKDLDEEWAARNRTAARKEQAKKAAVAQAADDDDDLLDDDDELLEPASL